MVEGAKSRRGVAKLGVRTCVRTCVCVCVYVSVCKDVYLYVCMYQVYVRVYVRWSERLCDCRVVRVWCASGWVLVCVRVL